MAEDSTLYLQLHKISATVSDHALGSVLSTLWSTRGTGVGSLEKSRIRFLLDSPSISELDPVLACLRSLIRKCVHEDYGEEDLLKLFPPDLPLELQSSLVLALLRHKNQWKAELSKEQSAMPRSSVPYQVQASLAPTFVSFPPSEASTSTRHYREDPSFSFNRANADSSETIDVDPIFSFSIVTQQQDDLAPGHPASLPRLKSMSWTMENSKASASKVAIITLKLEDDASSPSGEMEAKFQLTKGAFEAMLSSMSYIHEQLSNKVGASLAPSQKRQKH